MSKPAQHSLFKKVESKKSKSKPKGMRIAYSEGCPLDGELVKPESWPISYFTRYEAHIINSPACKEDGIFRKMRVWLRERQDFAT